MTAIAVVLIGAFVFTSMGFGSARGESTYTGYVVDTEIDKGLIFRTSQVHLKTHPRSSSGEEFCLTTEQHEQEAKEYLQNQQKVTVTYSRPLWVSPFSCEAQLSVLQNFNESSGVESP